MDGAVGEVLLETVNIPDEGIVGKGNMPEGGNRGGSHLGDEARKTVERALDGGNETFGFAHDRSRDDIFRRRKGAEPGLEDAFWEGHDGDDEEGADIFKGVAHPDVVVEVDAGDGTEMVGGKGEQGRSVLKSAKGGLPALLRVGTMKQVGVDGEEPGERDRGFRAFGIHVEIGLRLRFEFMEMR